MSPRILVASGPPTILSLPLPFSADLHRQRPSALFTYPKPMPPLDQLMGEWHQGTEEALKRGRLHSADRSSSSTTAIDGGGGGGLAAWLPFHAAWAGTAANTNSGDNPSAAAGTPQTLPIDLTLAEQARLACGLLDIPVYGTDLVPVSGARL